MYSFLGHKLDGPFHKWSYTVWGVDANGNEITDKGNHDEEWFYSHPDGWEVNLKVGVKWYIRADADQAAKLLKLSPAYRDWNGEYIMYYSHTATFYSGIPLRHGLTLKLQGTNCVTPEEALLEVEAAVRELNLPITED